MLFVGCVQVVACLLEQLINMLAELHTCRVTNYNHVTDIDGCEAFDMPIDVYGGS